MINVTLEQLKLHVDAEQFFRLLMREVFFIEKIERLARDLHYNHTMIHEERDRVKFSWLKPWEELTEEVRNSIRDQVRHIPSALHKVNYDLISVMEKSGVISFTARELNILAEYEHKLWLLHRKENGWKYGEIIDEKKKTHTSLVSWDSLPDINKNMMIKKIKAWLIQVLK